MICDAFFLQILSKLHFITPYFGHRGPVGSASAWQTRDHGFEPVRNLNFFLFLSQYIVGSNLSFAILFFAISVSRKISRCSAGVMFSNG